MADQFSKEVVMGGVRGGTQNLFLGIVAGIIAAFVGALAWMGITLATGLHIGYVALGVGALVGLTIRFVGNGTGMIFGIVGAVLTLLGCLGGDILATVQQTSTAQRDFFTTLTSMDMVQEVTAIFHQMDPLMYLIYAIGIYEGYKLSIRK